MRRALLVLGHVDEEGFVFERRNYCCCQCCWEAFGGKSPHLKEENNRGKGRKESLLKAFIKNKLIIFIIK